MSLFFLDNSRIKLYNKINNTIIEKIISGDTMKSNKKEIIEKLKQLDSDMALLDSSDDLYTCVIVGGSALVLMDKIFRSTHDIDSIASSEKIQPLLEAYNINMNVKAYLTNFPDDYHERLVPVEIETKKVKFYTVSTEDLVVSKLCASRDKDFEDIETKEVTENLNWKLMDRLIEDVCYGMLNEYDENHLRMRYEDYKERFM